MHLFQLFQLVTLCYIIYFLRIRSTFWSGLEELHCLVEQAETKAFPQTSLLDQLRIITTEADKVAVMAQQLLNGKRQTRYKKRFNNHSSQDSLNLNKNFTILHTNRRYVVCVNLMLVFIEPLSRICMYYRYRSGGGKSQNQNELTVEELRSFVQQFDNLLCNIRQAPLLKVS